MSWSGYVFSSYSTQLVSPLGRLYGFRRWKGTGESGSLEVFKLPLPPSTNSASHLLFKVTAGFPALPTDFSMLWWKVALQPVSQNKHLLPISASCEVLSMVRALAEPRASGIFLICSPAYLLESLPWTWCSLFSARLAGRWGLFWGYRQVQSHPAFYTCFEDLDSGPRDCPVSHPCSNPSKQEYISTVLVIAIIPVIQTLLAPTC